MKVKFNFDFVFHFSAWRNSSGTWLFFCFFWRHLLLAAMTKQFSFYCWSRKGIHLSLKFIFVTVSVNFYFCCYFRFFLGFDVRILNLGRIKYFEIFWPSESCQSSEKKQIKITSHDSNISMNFFFVKCITQQYWCFVIISFLTKMFLFREKKTFNDAVHWNCTKRLNIFKLIMVQIIMNAGKCILNSFQWLRFYFHWFFCSIFRTNFEEGTVEGWLPTVVHLI